MFNTCWWRGHRYYEVARFFTKPVLHTPNDCQHAMTFRTNDQAHKMVYGYTTIEDKCTNCNKSFFNVQYGDMRRPLTDDETTQQMKNKINF